MAYSAPDHTLKEWYDASTANQTTFHDAVIQYRGQRTHMLIRHLVRAGATAVSTAQVSQLLAEQEEASGSLIRLRRSRRRDSKLQGRTLPKTKYHSSQRQNQLTARLGAGSRQIPPCIQSSHKREASDLTAASEKEPNRNEYIHPKSRKGTRYTQAQRLLFAEHVKSALDRNQTLDCAEYSRIHDIKYSTVYSWQIILRQNATAFQDVERSSVSYTSEQRHQFAESLRVCLEKGETFCCAQYSRDHKIRSGTVGSWYRALQKDATKFLGPVKSTYPVEKRQFREAVMSTSAEEQRYLCRRFSSDRKIPLGTVRGWYRALKEEYAATTESRTGPTLSHLPLQLRQEQRTDFEERWRACQARGERFNRRKYGRDSGIPRSTVRLWHDDMKRYFQTVVESRTLRQQQRLDFQTSRRACRINGDSWNCLQYAKDNDIPKSTVYHWQSDLKKSEASTLQTLETPRRRRMRRQPAQSSETHSEDPSQTNQSSLTTLNHSAGLVQWVPANSISQGVSSHVDDLMGLDDQRALLDFLAYNPDDALPGQHCDVYFEDSFDIDYFRSTNDSYSADSGGLEVEENSASCE